MVNPHDTYMNNIFQKTENEGREKKRNGPLNLKGNYSRKGTKWTIKLRTKIH